jgi:hypothetical protein
MALLPFVGFGDGGGGGEERGGLLSIGFVLLFPFACLALPCPALCYLKRASNEGGIKEDSDVTVLLLCRD